MWSEAARCRRVMTTTGCRSITSPSRSHPPPLLPAYGPMPPACAGRCPCRATAQAVRHDSLIVRSTLRSSAAASAGRDTVGIHHLPLSSVPPSVRLSVRPSVNPSVCNPSVGPFIRPFIRSSVRPLVFPSASVLQSVCPSDDRFARTSYICTSPSASALSPSTVCPFPARLPTHRMVNY